MVIMAFTTCPRAETFQLQTKETRGQAGSHRTDKYIHEACSLIFGLISPPIRYPFGNYNIRTSIRSHKEEKHITSHTSVHQEKHA